MRAGSFSRYRFGFVGCAVVVVGGVACDEEEEGIDTDAAVEDEPAGLEAEVEAIVKASCAVVSTRSDRPGI